MMHVILQIILAENCSWVKKYKLHKLVGLWSFKNKLFALKNLNFSKQNICESRYPLYQLLFLGHFDKLRINLKPCYTTDQEVFFGMAYFLEWRNLNIENCISQVSCWPFQNVYLNQPDIRQWIDALIELNKSNT